MKNRRRLLLALTGLLVVLSACGGPSEVSVGASNDPNLATPEKPNTTEIGAVLEHLNTHVSDFGDGWTKTEEWYTEGAITEWNSGCAAFDRLGDMFNSGTPWTTVWERGDERAVNRTDDFNWGAYEFAYDVERVPDSCAEVTVGSQTVHVSAVDETIFSAARDRITEGDPNGVIVAIMLDAYPIPSLETDIALPEFEVDTPTWMVVTTRHNVVSQLIYAPGNDPDATGIAHLVELQVAALVDASVEGVGPFDAPSPPDSVAPATVSNVELLLGSCRNAGNIEAGGVVWTLNDLAPFEWEGRSSVAGDLAMDGTSATFTSYANSETPNVFTLQLTTGPVNASCEQWERDEPVEPMTAIGPLDCGQRLVVEDRFADNDHDPLEIAMTYRADVVRVEPGEPLWWHAFDADDQIVAVFAIGDAVNADWQVWTCG